MDSYLHQPHDPVIILISSELLTPDSVTMTEPMELGWEALERRKVGSCWRCACLSTKSVRLWVYLLSWNCVSEWQKEVKWVFLEKASTSLYSFLSLFINISQSQLLWFSIIYLIFSSLFVFLYRIWPSNLLFFLIFHVLFFMISQSVLESHIPLSESFFLKLKSGSFLLSDLKRTKKKYQPNSLQLWLQVNFLFTLQIHLLYP